MGALAPHTAGEQLSRKEQQSVQQKNQPPGVESRDKDKDGAREESSGETEGHSGSQEQSQSQVNVHSGSESQGQGLVGSQTKEGSQHRMEDESRGQVQSRRVGRSQNQSQMRNRSQLQSQARGENLSRDRSRSSCRRSSESGAVEVEAGQAVFPSLLHNNGEKGELQHTSLKDISVLGKAQEERMVVSDSASEGTTEAELNYVAEDRRKFSRDKKMVGKEQKVKKGKK